MDQERWRRVEALYFEALTRPDDERASFVAERCSGDADLERDVASLLAARDGADGFLSHGDLVEEIAELATDPMTEPMPAEIGPYRILGRLGAGAMGEVFRARDTRLERDVALKILPSLVRHHSSRLARFQLEARATSALNHPNIVTVHEIGEADGTWFIASELVDGETLRDTLAGGALPIARVIDIGIQCAGALSAAHAAGIIHRDVKPENVMVRKDGIVKVLDFGIARVTEERFGSGGLATETGSVLGTPRYMSPEQARRQPLDARTDVFSLGAVLFELKTGRPPFPGDTPAEVFAELLQASPVTNAGDAVDAIIAKALARDREARHQSMDELAAALRGVHPGTLTGQQGPVAGATRRWPVGPWAAIALAGLLLAGLLAAGAYRWWHTEPPGAEHLVLVPLTTFEGAKDFARFSPDGREIAFSWNGGREGATALHIYKKAINGPAVPLTDGAVDDTLPAWSPDGRQVAFLRGGTSVYIVPASGGAATRVMDGVGPGVGWSPDGASLVLVDQPPPKGTGGVFVLTLATGERRVLTTPAKGVAQYPVFSPDGASVAFMRDHQERDVFVVSSRGGAARQLTFDARPKLGAIAWTRDGRDLVYSAQREYGGAGLWRVSAAGGEPHRIAEALAFAGNPSIAHDGQRLAYTDSWIDSNIYESELVKPSDPPALGARAPRRLIASTREDHSPAVSPDGQRVAFISNRSGASEVWVARRDGTDVTQLTRFTSFAGTPRWSPDGQRIAFDLLQAGNRDVWVVAAAGGTPQRLTTASESDAKPSWAPDGAWIFFSSRRSGREEIWKMRPDGRDQRQITRGGAREALPAPDGRTLYFTRGAPGAIWTVPADGGVEAPVPELAAFAAIGRAWGLYREGLYFYWPDPVRHLGTVRFFDFATRQVTTIAEWTEESGWTGPAVAMSPDGRTLLAVRVDQRINDLMMIENFR